MTPILRNEVTLRFLGVFKKAYGNDQLSLRVKDNEKLRGIIERLTKVSPNIKKVLVDPELGTPSPNAIILINGIEAHLLNGLETKLKDKDEIVFIPIIHGG
ncbi:MAG: MoaD/ThiS family protein [Candidatus Bathyarchaeia archaeon]